MASLEFLEKEDRPFVFDRSTWELFRMDGIGRSTWFKIENDDSCLRIRSQASGISEAEAKSLAGAIAREDSC